MAPIDHIHTHTKKREIIDTCTTYFNNMSVQTGWGHGFFSQNTVLVCSDENFKIAAILKICFELLLNRKAI